MRILLSLTSARARDTRERWPIDKFEPSSSMGLSSVKRGAFGVVDPVPRWSSSPSIPASSSFAEEMGLESSTRYERLSASQSRASSCSSNGSRLDRSVPETKASVRIPMCLRYGMVPRTKSGILRYNRDCVSNIIKPDLGDIDAVDADRT